MRKILIGAMVLVVFSAFGCAATEQGRREEPPGNARTADDSAAQAIVDRARATFNEFMADPNFPWLREHLKNVKGVLIFPQVLKAGFFLGGSGGNGVLSVRDEKSGDWSQPCFYTVSSVTFGLQIGAEAVEVIMLVMSPKGIEALYTSSFQLGGGLSAAAGFQGGGVKSDITADFLSFVRAKGIFIGMDLEGSVISVRKGLNASYYGKDVTPAGILVQKEAGNEGAAEFLAALKKAAR
jgi:SH3 domain-containing YSC84-like protein 1